MKGKRTGVERWSELLTGGTVKDEAGPALCRQSTDIDSTLFTICQYYSQGTRFETGASVRLHGKVRGRRKNRKRPFEAQGGIGDRGIGEGWGWSGTGKIKTRILLPQGCGTRRRDGPIDLGMG